MDIVGFVADKTGLSRDTAEVAVALILKYAQGKLGDKFDMVAPYIPGCEELIAKAPEGGVMGTIGSLATSVFGGGAEKDGEPSMANLVGQLGEAGVSPQQVPAAAGAVAEYVNQQEDGNDATSIITSLLVPGED